MNKQLKRAIIFVCIVAISAATGYRIQKIRKEGIRTVNNIARIHAEKGVPNEYVTAKKTTEFLYEPIYIQNGRALVSINRVNKFAVGESAGSAKIVSISKNIDLDTGMFVIRFSEKITGDFMVARQYTGFFLPVDAEIPAHARVIAKDNERMVVTGLVDGDKVVVK